MWVFLGMETIANIKYRSHVDSDSCLLAVCRWLIPHEVAPQQSFTMLQPANAKVIIKNGTTKNNHIYFILQFDPLKHSINNSSCNLTYTPENIGLVQRVSFKIMGKYDDAYEQWLKEEVKRLGLEESVEFVGFVSGKDKYERLAQLSALMVPSAQENFGMIVPEALICGTPVYASLGTPWNELNECHCGWWRDNEPATIANVIKEILSLSNDELLEMGRNGRKLMEEKYEQHKVASMMKRLYEWIVIDKMEKDKRPEFVYDCCSGSGDNRVRGQVPEPSIYK